MATSFLISELTAAALTPGQAFDGLVAGTFRDMHGKVVTFTAEMLGEFVANTQAVINVSRAESGEIVGLPIDARDHDKGDGAGWIVGIELAGGIIRLFPKWTELGRDAIGKGIRRFFSATVDLVNKVILGGTLTNWPATRDPQGRVLLRPIELASRLFQWTDMAADESLDEKSSKVRQAFYDAHQPEMSTPWVLEVYDDYLICRYGESLYHVPYDVAADGTPTFADQAKWVEVKPAYVEAAAPPAPAEGDDEMGVTLDDVKTVVTAALAEFKTSLPAPMAPAAVDLSAMFDLSGLDDAAKATRKTQIEAHLAAVRSQATREYQLQISQLQREGQIAELAQRLTAGTESAPRGIPGVTTADLQAHLMKLDPAEAKFFGDVLDRIVKDGLVEFAELGHGKRLAGTTPLPAEFATKLESGELKVADLSNPILGLGDLAAYDLTKWQAK